jgi:hypothetical protein
MVYRWLCWLPLMILLAVEVYVAGFDGRGAWAAAPMLLLPAIASILVVFPGIARIVSQQRPAEETRRLILLTTVAAAPLGWLLVRRFVM